LGLILDISKRIDNSKSGLRFGAVIGFWVVLLMVLVNVRTFNLRDNMQNVLIPVSILREGNVELSEFKGLLQQQADDYGQDASFVETARGVYPKYPIWSGVIATPFFIPFAWNDSLLLHWMFWLRTGYLSALVLCGVLAGSLAVRLRSYMQNRWAVALTFFAIFGTGLWHHIGSQLANQTLPVLCITFVLFFTSAKKMNSRKALFVGLLAGLGASARLSVIFTAFLPLGIFISKSNWRRFIPWVFCGGVIFPTLTLVYNALAFGHPIATGYSFYPYDKFSAPFVNGFIGLAISPTCGLFIYSPFLIFGAWKGASCLFRKSKNAEDAHGRWIILGAIGQWILLSKWWAWNGGFTYGSRMMIETVPGLTLLIAYHWPYISARTPLKKWLLILGIISVLWYFIGCVTFDSVAQLRLWKNSWDPRADFIFLFIDHFGWNSFFLRTVKLGTLFLTTFLLGGYVGIRLLSKK